MDNLPTLVQHQLSDQIKIRDRQGQWRRTSNLSQDEITQRWNETDNEIREWENPEQSAKG
ncbi:MAG: hypothetical protein NPIRA02_38380 [Nitrospirales bacterium]|nr:MAG: hypothetical protein NPIRA02_38380 [Nitrospirales bacterium]